jgi:hypothetical protein
MHIVYLLITILVALANGYAASLNFAGAESVKVVADHVQVSQKWMIPFGMLLASGAVGLLVGRSLSSSVRRFAFEFIEQRPPSAC